MIQTLRFHLGLLLRAQRRAITTFQTSDKHSRRPIRGGRNLSERYKVLEQSMRGKDALRRELVSNGSSGIPHRSNLAAVPTFYGFRIPQVPNPPADDECCMSGCAVCVYDLYEESLASYQEAVSTLRKSLAALKVPESEWPTSIRTQIQVDTSENHRKNTILNTFEEMERTLAMKRQTEEAARKSRQNQRRNQLVQLEESYPNLSELFEGVRWLLFSRR